MNFSLIRIGFFSLIGITIVVGFSFYVNDRPYWYKPCRSVDIFVSDATGLRRKSPVKSLGLEIGYINEVQLEGEKVLLKVCITAPVRLRPNTKASVKTVGFLGDKILELKPVEMIRSSFFDPGSEKEINSEIKLSQSAIDSRDVGEDFNRQMQREFPQDQVEQEIDLGDQATAQKEVADQPHQPSGRSEPGLFLKMFKALHDFIFPSANANNRKTLTADDEAGIADLISKGEKLVDQLNYLVKDVRKVTSQEDFQSIIKNMNRAVKNFERLVSPESVSVQKLNSAVDHLKSSLMQAEEIMSKVNRGHGTLGKLINDPSLYDEARGAIRSVNLLLGKAGVLKTYVDLRAVNVKAYDDGYRGTVLVRIEPNPTRYYLIGVGNDPRGKIKTRRTEFRDEDGNLINAENRKDIEVDAFLVTAMFGKYLWGFDLRVGVIDNSGGLGIGYWFDKERRYGIHGEFFRRTQEDRIQTRVYGIAHIYKGIYAIAGTDEFKKSEVTQFTKDQVPWFIGAGITFNDEDLKYLLAFR